MLSSTACIVEPPLPGAALSLPAAQTKLLAPWRIAPGFETSKFRETKPILALSTTLIRKKKSPEMWLQFPRLDNSPAVFKLIEVLSEYISADSRWREREFSPEDRRASVASVLSSGSLLSAMDRVRSHMEASHLNTILRRFGELKQSQEVGLVKEPMKTTSIITRKTCAQLIRWPVLRAFGGLERCASNTSSRLQVLVRCASSDQEVYSVPGSVPGSVSQRFTGLPMVVYISAKNSFSNPCIKVSQYYGDEIRLGEWFSMTIAEEPRVIGDTGYIRVRDVAYACKFIQKNRETLMRYWNQDELFETLDMLKCLEKIVI